MFAHLLSLILFINLELSNYFLIHFSSKFRFIQVCHFIFKILLYPHFPKLLYPISILNLWEPICILIDPINYLFEEKSNSCWIFFICPAQSFRFEELCKLIKILHFLHQSKINFQCICLLIYIWFCLPNFW